MLIEETLKCYDHDKIKELILDYYTTFKIRRVSKKSTSSFREGYRYRLYHFGYFIYASDEFGNKNCWNAAVPPPRFGLRQPPIRAYTDGSTLTITSSIGARWILKMYKTAHYMGQNVF